MKVPRKVYIGGHEFDVIYKDKIVDEDGEHLGICKADENYIILEKKMKRSKKEEIFLHECIHAISDLFELNLSEKAVSILGIELRNLFARNHL